MSPHRIEPHPRVSPNAITKHRLTLGRHRSLASGLLLARRPSLFPPRLHPPSRPVCVTLLRLYFTCCEPPLCSSFGLRLTIPQRLVVTRSVNHSHSASVASLCSNATDTLKKPDLISNPASLEYIFTLEYLSILYRYLIYI